jgi:uncharacterized coiled-coil protein SlyX
MTTLEDICTCEFGPLLGDGRTDSNRCPVHDMTREELVEYAANGWREVAALEARIEELEKRLTETGVRVEDTLDDLSHVLDMLGATEEQLALSRYTLAQARSVASSANLTGHGDGNTGPTAALRGEEER